MSKNIKSVICCVLTLILVAGTIIFAFAGNDNANVVETETASEVESVIGSEVESGVNGEEESEIADNALFYGDMDKDGKVTPADARTALRIAAELDIPTDDQVKLADVNGDNKITASDARSILRVAAGLDPMFSTIVL